MRNQQYRINFRPNDPLRARFFQEIAGGFELIAKAVRPFWLRYGPVCVPAFRHLPGQDAHALWMTDLIVEVFTDDRRQEDAKLFSVDSFAILHTFEHNQDQVIF